MCVTEPGNILLFIGKLLFSAHPLTSYNTFFGVFLRNRHIHLLCTYYFDNFHFCWFLYCFFFPFFFSRKYLYRIRRAGGGAGGAKNTTCAVLKFNKQFIIVISYGYDIITVYLLSLLLFPFFFWSFESKLIFLPLSIFF